MKKILKASLGIALIILIWNNFAPAEVNLPFNLKTLLINELLGDPHTWTGTQTFSGTITATGTTNGFVPANITVTNATQTWTATQTLATVEADIFRGGASLFANAPSGTSLLSSELNTFMVNNLTTSQIYNLPKISGSTIMYLKVMDGANAGGVTLVTADTGNEPFMWSGNSGTSTLALPPGNPFEKATIYGITLSGTCKYWFVEADTNWVAGN